MLVGVISYVSCNSLNVSSTIVEYSSFKRKSSKTSSKLYLDFCIFS